MGFSIYPNKEVNWKYDGSERVFKVLSQLGYKPVSHLPDYTIEHVSPQVGEDIIKFGISKRKGEKKSKRQSKHFVCTSCHNLEREDPDLTNPNPEDRLVYGNKNGIPFLQASSLYGAVNRTSFYNGDYEKKYGDLVIPARNDIREAIQLCAVECSQGRKLKEWEVESILSYLWTIDLKLADLNISETEKLQIESAQNGGTNPLEAIKTISAKYLDHSPAHFVAPPDNRKEGYGLEGDFNRGKMVYDQSCLHCHKKKKYSYLNLDHSDLTFDWLRNKMSTYSRYSIYQVIRYGTFSKHGKSSYMPRYTEEKMSDQQVEDLRAYIEFMAD